MRSETSFYHGKYLYNDINLTHRQEQVLIGSLFGDGSLFISPNCTNPRFDETHCLKQEKYLDWKISELMVLNPKVTYRNAIAKGKSFPQKRMMLPCHPLFWGYYNLLYPMGIKNRTLAALNKLDILGIAIWYYDNGYLHTRKHNNHYIEWGCFTKEEANVFQLFLKAKYDIKTTRWLVTGKPYYIIALNIENTVKFLELIKKEVIPLSMEYKIYGKT